MKIALVQAVEQEPVLLLSLSPVQDLSHRFSWVTQSWEFSPEELAKAGADQQFLEKLEEVVGRLEEMVGE